VRKRSGLSCRGAAQPREFPTPTHGRLDPFGGQMSKEIRFSVDDDDYPVLALYAKQKGHRSVSNLARYATFALMARNPVGRHDSRGGAVRTEASDEVSEGQS
jgi:hypothetical protein